MAKENKAGAVDVKFAVPAFRYEGKEYKSADVEKAAEAGDEEAQAIVANLVAMGSGIVTVVSPEEESEAAAPAAAPKKSKKKKEATNE